MVILLTNEEFQKAVLEELSGIKKQMSETNGIVKSLIHHSEVMGAELSGLRVTTASLDAVKRIEKTITLMNAKVSSKEDIAELRMHMLDEVDAVRSEIKAVLLQGEENIRADMKSLFEIAGEHEVKIRNLIRRPV